MSCGRHVSLPFNSLSESGDKAAVSTCKRTVLVPFTAVFSIILDDWKLPDLQSSLEEH